MSKMRIFKFWNENGDEKEIEAFLSSSSVNSLNICINRLSLNLLFAIIPKRYLKICLKRQSKVKT